MGLLTGLFERRELNISPRLERTLASNVTAAGVTVTPDRALQAAAVFACVRVLSESVAQLPLQLFRQSGDNKTPATNHPLYNILHNLPNPELTSFELRELLMVHLCLRGNAYCEIVWGADGHVAELWPLHPDRVWPRRGTLDNQLYYDVTQGWAGGYERQRETVSLPHWKVWHLRGLGTDGVMGLSPIRLFAQSIGLSMAAEEFGARFFGNDARPGGVLQHPGTLSDTAHENLKKSWESRHQGLDKSHRIGILEEGMSYQQIGIRPDEAQFLETRKFQVSDIARIYRVPPHMAGDLDKATFSNIEHQGIGFVTHTLMPWLVRFEQAITRDLLLSFERLNHFADFNVAGLLRGDTQTRYASYAVGRQWGWLSANDIRQLENLNHVDGGDVYLSPLNMVPVDQLTAPETDPLAPKPARSADTRVNNLTFEQRTIANSRHRLYVVGRDLFAHALKDVFKAEVSAIREARSGAATHEQRGAEFNSRIDTFYDGFAAEIERLILPTATTYTETVSAAVNDEVEHNEDLDRWLRAYVAAYARRHIGRSRAAIERTEEPDLDALFESWSESRVDTVATDESVRLNNAIAVTIYAAVGIQRLRWAAVGKSCPYCLALSGRTVGINQYFIEAGEDFNPEGATVVLRPSTNVRHAPAHGGCDCMVIASG